MVSLEVERNILLEKYKYCRNCGNRLPEEVYFCDMCGSNTKY